MGKHVVDKIDNHGFLEAFSHHLLFILSKEHSCFDSAVISMWRGVFPLGLRRRRRHAFKLVDTLMLKRMNPVNASSYEHLQHRIIGVEIVQIIQNASLNNSISIHASKGITVSVQRSTFV